MPLEVVHAIYQDVPGAEFDTEWGEYTLPCDSKINISVLVGYVLDPLTKTEAMIYSKKSIAEKKSPYIPSTRSYLPTQAKLRAQIGIRVSASAHLAQ